MREEVKRIFCGDVALLKEVLENRLDAFCEYVANTECVYGNAHDKERLCLLDTEEYGESEEAKHCTCCDACAVDCKLSI